MPHSLKLRTTLMAALLVAAACAVRSPSIADLTYNPGRYYDRDVDIEGTVTTSWGIPLVPLKLYKVGDGTGEVTVVSDSQNAPPRGARVRVRGRVAEFAHLGGGSIGMHVREKSLHILRRD